MNSRSIGYISAVVAALTGTWIICMVVLLQQQGSVLASFEDAFEFVRDPGTLFYITYLNVVALTILDVVLFGMLYLYFKTAYPVLSLSGLLFVPVYAAYNMFVYISQVTVVQRILSLYEGQISEEVLQVLLGQFLQLWEHSTIAFINNYAYAILGIPSALFGIAIFRMKPGLPRITGVLLILSGLASMLGLVGIIAGNKALGSGSAIGGGIFFLSLIGMAILFRKG